MFSTSPSWIVSLHYFVKPKVVFSETSNAEFVVNKFVLAINVVTMNILFVHVRYMSSSVCLSVVCLSVTFVHPTQAIEIFGNVSTPFITLAIFDLSVKILLRSSHGNPSVGEIKHKRRGVAEYSDFGPIERYISETAQDRSEVSSLLITNRKSHMSFRLVPNWVTLDDLEIALTAT